MKKVNFKYNTNNRENSNERSRYRIRGFRNNSRNKEERFKNYKRNSDRYKYRNNRPYTNISDFGNRELNTDINCKNKQINIIIMKIIVVTTKHCNKQNDRFDSTDTDKLRLRRKSDRNYC